MLLRAAVIAAIMMGGLVVPRFWRPPGDPGVYYPNASLRLEETGRIVIRVDLDPRGKAIEPVAVDEARSTLNSPRFVESAQNYLRNATFDIGPQYRKTVTVSFVFELEPCGSIEQGEADYAVHLCHERLPKGEYLTPGIVTLQPDPPPR
jgi:TonB-like protein